jgi:hypothetical protein
MQTFEGLERWLFLRKKPHGAQVSVETRIENAVIAVIRWWPGMVPLFPDP